MALVVADRVKETTTTTGTGTVSLAGAQPNFVTFSSALSDGDTTFYAIVDNANLDFEVGVGTYASSGNTLARTTVLESSNSGSLVNFGSGTKDVFVTYPADKSVKLDANGKIAGNQTFAGTVTLNADPVSPLQAATKQYVDDLTAAAIHYHDPCRVESPTALTVTYNNGTSGVGATLTNAGTQAALVIDGVTLSTSDRVLIYTQTDQTQNGVYTVTDVGSASTNWVLTRATDADTYSPSDPTQFGEGDAFYVQEGSTGAGELYVMNTSGTITFGTTDITFVQISSAQVYSAGTGISISGNTISTNLNLEIATANGSTMSSTITVGGDADVAGTVFTPNLTYDVSTVTSTTTTTLNFSASSIHKVNMATNITFVFSNASAGQNGVIYLQQDSSGGRTFTLPAAAKTPLGGAAISQVTTANSLSILSYSVMDSSNILVNYIGNFA